MEAAMSNERSHPCVAKLLTVAILTPNGTKLSGRERTARKRRRRAVRLSERLGPRPGILSIYQLMNAASD
jgi:hypothetical protein